MPGSRWRASAAGWYRDILISEWFLAALGRQFLFTGLILTIEIPLGVAIALAMPRSGPWVSVCLVLMAMPLLIPWNVVGAMWNIFALPDIGLLVYPRADALLRSGRTIGFARSALKEARISTISCS